MSDFSNYAENAIVNHLFRNVALTSPTTVYLALGTAVSSAETPTWTEVSGGGYARKAITFGAPTDGVIGNSATVTFGPATASWGTPAFAAIYDALTGGNALSAVKALGTAEAITSGMSMVFAPGAITFTVA